MSLINIDKVSIGANRRPLKEEKVADLMQSIQTNGLLNPITLDQNFTLIAGLHRLTACKLLGFTQIECKVVECDRDQARLAEIDENLIRNELDALERSELWLERDQILERLGLRARAGDNQYTQRPETPKSSPSRGSETNSPPLKTTVALAQEIGYTERTFQQGKQIARDITPEVKKAIRGTAAAKSPQTLLKVARAGTEERKQAEQAERAAQEAKAKRLKVEAEKQATIAAEARAKQKELQLVALHSVEAEKQAKLANKKQALRKEQSAVAPPIQDIHLGDTWLLKRHLVYYGDSASDEFLDCLPSNAALAIVPPQVHWNHDYLVDEARLVAVLRTPGTIHEFCRTHRMPFQFELLVSDLYIGLYSHHTLLKPDQPLGIDGIEGIVTYLISLYTKPSNFVLNPGLGNGEVLVTCERMERVCFAGDADSERVSRALDRWQKWTGKTAEKTDLFA